MDKDDTKASCVGSIQSVKNIVTEEFIFNKRFWKWVAFYLMVYGSFRKFFNRFYINNKNTNPNTNANNEEEMEDMEFDVVGESAHRPTELVMGFINSVINFIRGRYIWNRQDLVLQSALEKLEIESEIDFIEMHKAFWCVMLVLTRLHSTNSVLIFHHIASIILFLWIKRSGHYGKFGIYVGFWSEFVGIFLCSAGMLRWVNAKIYMDKNDTLVSMSNGMFMIFVFFFLYNRMYLFSKMVKPQLDVMNKRKDMNRIQKYIFYFLTVGGLSMNWYWSLQTIYSVATNIKDRIKNNSS
eukprot:298383_1